MQIIDGVFCFLNFDQQNALRDKRAHRLKQLQCICALDFPREVGIAITEQTSNALASFVLLVQDHCIELIGLLLIRLQQGLMELNFMPNASKRPVLHNHR